MCSESDKEPPNEIPKQKKSNHTNTQCQNNGVNSQQQRRISATMHIPLNRILVVLKVLLKKNTEKLFTITSDKTELSELKSNPDELFSFQILEEFQKNNLTINQQHKEQVENIGNLIMHPYRRSYELMRQKKFFICNIQSLLEILQDLFYDKIQEKSLDYLKNHFHRLTKRFQEIKVLVKKDHLIELKIRGMKELDRENQKPMQMALKSQLKDQIFQPIGRIISSSNQKRIRVTQENQQIMKLNIGLRHQVQSFKQIISNKEDQQNRMRRQISVLKNQKQASKAQIESKEQQITLLKEHSKNHLLELQAKKLLVDMLTSQNQKLHNSITEFTKQKYQLQNKVKDIRNLEAETQVLKQRIRTVSQENRDLYEKLRKINDQKSMVESQKRALQTEKDTLEAQRRTIMDEKNRFENQILMLQELLKEQKMKSHKAQVRLIQIVKQKDSMKIIFSNLLKNFKLTKLFTGDILETLTNEKAFLIESIEKHMNRKIDKAKILYDTKKNYNVDYHERIDGKQNIVLVLQTPNAIIAGYYSGKYAEGTYMTSEGLILSLNNQKYYRLNNFANNPMKNKNDTRPVYGMIYDKFFLIFGNAQIRLKPGDKDRKVFSNLGISNSYYNSQGDNVNHLLCNGKKNEVQFIDYQIYQLIFSQQEEQQTRQQAVTEQHQNEKAKQAFQTNNNQNIAKKIEESIRKDDHIYQLNRQLKQLKSIKQELKHENKRLSSNIDQTQKQLSRLQSQSVSLSQKLKSKEEQLFTMKQKIENSERLSIDAEEKYITISTQLHNLKQLNTEYSSQNIQLRNNIISLQKQLIEVKKNLQIQKKGQSQNSRIRVNTQNSEEIKIISSFSQVSLSEYSMIKEKLQSALTTCQSYKIQKQDKIKQIQDLKAELSNQKVLYEKKCQETQQLIRNKCSLQEQRDSLLTIYKKKGVENQDYKRMQQKLKEMQQENKIIKQALQRLQQKSLRMRTQSFVQMISHFSGELLQKRKDQKRFLIESIQCHMKKSIEKTRILYESVKDTKINFHERLNGKQNLVIVLQTSKALFSGYYSGLYAKNITMNEEGLILSLTNRKYYCLNNLKNYPNKNKNDKRNILGMIYDDYYLIFGNSEIRVKPGQNNSKVFSNFGVSQAFFHNKGDNFSILLREDKKNEVPVIRYEIYELIFYNIQNLQPAQ